MADQGLGDVAEVVDHPPELIGRDARQLQPLVERLQRGQLDAFDDLVADRGDRFAGGADGVADAWTDGDRCAPGRLDRRGRRTLDRLPAPVNPRFNGGRGPSPDNSRISLDLVVEQYDNGMLPEDMVRTYDTLELADVYAVINHDERYSLA